MSVAITECGLTRDPDDSQPVKHATFGPQALPLQFASRQRYCGDQNFFVKDNLVEIITCVFECFRERYIVY